MRLVVSDTSSFVGEAFGPADNEGNPDPAFEGGGFVVAEGSAFEIGPAVCHVGNDVALPGANLFLGVNRAVAVIATVVGKEDDEGVVSDLFVIEELENASDIGIEVGNDGGIALHTERFVFASGFGKFLPASDLGHGRGVAIAVVDEAQFAKSGNAFFAEDGPTFVEGSVVFFDEITGNVERGVGCVEGEVGEEGLVGFE